MEASRVILNKDMLDAMASPLLSEEKKTQLRTTRIIDYIKSQPPGTPIKIDELIYQAGYNRVYSESYKRGWTLVQRLIKNKTIIQEKIVGKRGQALYFIPGGARLVGTVPKYEAPKPLPKQAPQPLGGKAFSTEGRVVPMTAPDYSKNIPSHQWVVDRAKKFAWDNNSDSLRAFIATL